MWVRFWNESNCPSGLNVQESRYEWVSDREDDESLKEWAEELVPECLRWSERGYKYGFERLEVLPESARAELEASYKLQKRGIDKMLRRLKRR